MAVTYRFCTRIQVKQIKTKLINKSGEKGFPRILEKIFYTEDCTYNDLYKKILWKKQNYSEEYIQRGSLHAVINTENHYCEPKTI